MDCLKDKTIKSYDYTSRYASFPYYYNLIDDKYMYGITGQLKQNVNYAIHIVKDFDTLDSLALKYYGRPDLYWIIADYNRIRDPFINLYNNYKSLNIPDITEIGFDL